jgi:hypothetical protein
MLMSTNNPVVVTAPPVAPAPQAAQPVDKLNELETRVAQLCQPQIAPTAAPASATSPLTAVTVLAKSISMDDFFNRTDLQLLRLLTTLTSALEKLKSAPADKSLTAAVAALKKVAAQIEREREDILLAKAEALRTLALPSTKLAKVRELLKDMKIHFHDREFLFHFVKILIERGPTLLCTILKEIPLTDKSDILQLGALLKKPELRAQFAAHYKIPKEEMENARAQYLKSVKEVLSRQNGHGGNCNGHTLTQISRNPPSAPQAFHRSAMFVQAAYRVQIKKGAHFAAPLQKIGRAILDEPHIYPQILAKAAKVLGYASVEELIFDDMAKKKPLQLAQLVGQVASDFAKSLPPTSEEVAALKFLDDTSNAAPCSVSDEIPPAILKRLGLKAAKIIAPAAPFNDLADNLKALKDKSGKILIDLHGDTGNHALCICFDPPSFSDINDSDLITFDPKVRTFTSADEMIEALRKHLLFTYGEDFDTFALIRYEEIPSSALTPKKAAL